jgi:hypothetical protein
MQVKQPPPPPSLPYKVDTSRPSLRTNWTRLAAHNAGVCKRLGIGCAADAREARALLEHARGLLARRERDRPASGLLEGVYGPASEQHAPLTVDAAGLGGAGPAEAERAGGEAAAAAVQLAEMLLAGEGAQARARAPSPPFPVPTGQVSSLPSY